MTTPTEAPQAADRWEPTLDTFGARLAAIRHKLGWNVKEAALACGLPPQNWRNWEAGDEPRRLVTIAMAIAGRTGVGLDWLVYGPDRGAISAPRDLTVRYPRTPRRGVGERVITQVGHGDARRRPGGRVTPVRSSQRSRPTRQGRRPVSRTAVA
jgi:transcriptional regulator with XRE-family HTH domain